MAGFDDAAQQFDARRWRRAPTLARFLNAAPPLTRPERRRIVDQAIRVLRDYYVHLPMKRASHGIEPIRQLEVLRRRLPEIADDIAFHERLHAVFASLCDLHTNYLLPEPYTERVAFLPFQIAAFTEGGRRRYLVTHVLRGLGRTRLQRGAEIVLWNGMSIAQAVERAAQRSGGANPAAQLARATAAMTLRLLAKLPPPEEDRVRIRLRDGRRVSDVTCDWRVTRLPDEAAPHAIDPRRGPAHHLGLDLETDALRRMRHALRAAPALPRQASFAARREVLKSWVVESDLPSVFQAHRIRFGDKRLGHVRVLTFKVTDSQPFVAEFLRLIDELRAFEGLILDVRDNGGGLVEAAEMLLQLLTPHRIEPARMQFIATDAVRDLCRRQRPRNPRMVWDLSAWLPSVEHALASGGRYSAALPMNDPDAVNAIGQRYHGPVVLLTSALCYSATDIFVAGFRDHGIGPIIGVDGNTGAGGANVWTAGQLGDALGDASDDAGGKLGALPRGAGLRVALRRSLRVGAHAGTELEEIGVVPDEVVPATRRDALEGSVDLIALAAQRLIEREWFRLDAEILARPGRERTLFVTTRGIERLDATLDGRPLLSRRIAPHPSGKDGMKTPVYDLPLRAHGTLELRGYRRGRLVAARKLAVERS